MLLSRSRSGQRPQDLGRKMFAVGITARLPRATSQKTKELSPLLHSAVLGLVS